jgi:manganese/zinc/iron transport system substrate-binding protein
MRILYVLLLIYVCSLSACRPTEPEERDRPLIVVTTSMLADAVRNIVKDSADVQALMGPGVDPHLYKASIGDLRKLVSADYVFYQGLHLEGKLGEVLAKLSRTQEVYALADGLPQERIILADEQSGYPDPHIWFDVSLWKELVGLTNGKMAELMPGAAEYFNKNATAYMSQLDSLETSIHQRMERIPARDRVLITSHDAFSYFGAAYNIEVMGLQGISTLAEFGLRDVSDLVKIIVSRDIKAVFIENSVSSKSLDAVVAGASQQGSEVRIGGTLYTDALGDPDGPEGSYIGMMNYNINTIIKALE